MGIKFQCEKGALSGALNVAGRAVSGRDMDAGGGGIKLEQKKGNLTLTGGDGELMIAVNIKVKGQSSGESIAPARLMNDIVRALPEGDIGVEIDDKDAKITSGASEFSLRVAPVGNFPLITTLTADGGDAPFTNKDKPIKVDAEKFKSATDRVGESTSADQGRPILTGIMMTSTEQGLRMVATDSYRLAMIDIEGMTTITPENKEVLVPVRALKELSRVVGDEEEIELRLNDRNISFAVANKVITSTLIQGTFPDYNRLIPDEKGESTLTINRKAVANTLKRISLIAIKEKPVTLTLSESGPLKVSATSQDVGEGEEVIDGEYVGEDLSVSFNPTYLIGGLSTSQGDDVRLQLNGDLKPVIMRSTEDETYLYLLMPVRNPSG